MPIHVEKVYVVPETGWFGGVKKVSVSDLASLEFVSSMNADLTTKNDIESEVLPDAFAIGDNFYSFWNLEDLDKGYLL